MRRRIIEASLGFILILIALLTAFQNAELSILIGLIGLALLWHQHQLGKATRHIRPARPERREHNSRRQARRARRQMIGSQIAEALKTALAITSERGLEAGLEELGQQIERAAAPANRRETQPASAAPPGKGRARRAQVVELSSDEAYAHAVDAARAAGLELSRTAVIPVDVGLIVYDSAETRSIHRTAPINSNAAFVQPFIQLNMPTRAVGRIRYEIIDSDGQAVFIHEDEQALERGVNLLTPAARMRMHSGTARYGRWRLAVSADGVMLLDHSFIWQEDSRARLRRHLYEDGELTQEARLLIEDEISGPGISIDDLLGAQDDGAARATRG